MGLCIIGCAPAGSERDPITVQATSVQGERIAYQDLGDTDTLLWFWAPW